MADPGKGGVIFSRKQGESVLIGETIIVHVLEVSRTSSRVRLQIRAPKDVDVDREEIRKEIIRTGRRRRKP